MVDVNFDGLVDVVREHRHRAPDLLLARPLPGGRRPVRHAQLDKRWPPSISNEPVTQLRALERPRPCASAIRT